MPNPTRQLVAAAFAALALASASAQTVAPPQGVVGLAASASVEVANDLLSVTLGTTREGADAAAVQAQLRQALDSALAEARRAARPGQVEVRTGSFGLVPRHDRNGRISGWQGSTDMVVEGRDMAAIGALATRLTTLAVTRVGQSLSREAREKAEGEVAAQAIARFCSKADEVARHFGYAGWTMREVNVTSADTPPMPIPRARVMAMAADEALPVEAGKATVTVSVGGTVQLTR
jgi:predicted secreted protein